MFERILVTGHSGFAGHWVIEELRRRFPTAEIYGAARRPKVGDRENSTSHHWLQLDLRDCSQIMEVVAAVRPDAVVHLAGVRLAPLEEQLAVNVAACEHLLTSLNTIVPKARIVVVGSAAELGRAADRDVPLDEETLCQPVDVYGVTKLAQSALARKQALRGQDIVVIRPFNLLGPGVPITLLAGRFARLLRDAARGDPNTLEFGPLDTRRDYIDVRDFAHAVALALEKSLPGMLYHIGTGVSRSGHDLVKALIKQTGLDVTYKTTPSTEKSLVPWQTADWRRARQMLGWQPTMSWDNTIRDIWEFARPRKAEAELCDPQ